MSQPVLFGREKACPNQLIWLSEHIRCPKFGRGAGVQQRLGQCPNLGTFYFLMASLTYNSAAGALAGNKLHVIFLNII